MYGTLVQILCPKVQLVLCTSCRFSPKQTFHKITFRISGWSTHQTGISIYNLYGFADDFVEILVLEANRFFHDSFAQTQFDRIKTYKGKVTERNKLVFVVQWHALIDLGLIDLSTSCQTIANVTAVQS